MIDPISSWAFGVIAGGVTGFWIGRWWPMRSRRMCQPQGSYGSPRQPTFAELLMPGDPRPVPTTAKPDILPKGQGPRPGCARCFINNAAQIAECGGPCTRGPSHCDCGALWLDVPSKPQFPSPRVIPGDMP